MFALTATVLAATLVGAPSPIPQAPGVRVNLSGVPLDINICLLEC